jgi:hypothetical protein
VLLWGIIQDEVQKLIGLRIRMRSGDDILPATKEDLHKLIGRIDQVLEDGVVEEEEFREFEVLILESLRAILRILSKE